MNPPGRAVQVVTLSEGNNSDEVRQLRLDTQVLRSILAETEGHPIAVIAIAGPARGGKSFIMSYIVRYLQSLENSHDGTAGDWMNKEQPDVSLKDKGFEFTNNLDKTTEGIWMWSRPFIIKSKKCAVLLMDTEGCFDAFTSEKEQSCIIGLSLLLSSCFIFNESVRINENTLMTLSKFAQFGKIASQAFDGMAFQRLMFLVRDWSNPDIFGFGAAGGQGLIQKTMERRPRMAREALQNRDNVSENFEHFNAYLMPHPGCKVLSSEYNGCIADMSKEFQFYLENFVTGIVADIVPKKIGTESAVNTSYYDLFCRLVDAFNQDDIPNPNSYVEATIFAAFESQVVIFAKSYMQELMGKLVESKAPFHTEEKLRKYHQRIRKSIIGQFSVKRHHGNEEQKQIFANKLGEKLESIFNNVVTENEEKQQEFVRSWENAALQKFFVFIEDTFTTANKIWFEPEFFGVVTVKEEELVEDFLKATKEAPDNVIQTSVVSLRQAIFQAKSHIWNTLEEKTQKAEKSVRELISGLESTYEILMDVLLSDDEVLRESKIIKTHEKQLRIAESSFFGEIKQKFSDPCFIEKSYAELKTAFQKKLDKYLAENKTKMDRLIAVLEQDMCERMRIFDEQLTPLTAKISSLNFEEDVNRIHSNVLQDTLLSISELDIPDTTIMNSLRQKYRSTLDARRDTVLQSRQYITHKNEATVQSLLKNLVDKLSRILASQDVFDPKKLEELYFLNYQESKSNCESALLGSKIEYADLLNRFDTLALLEREKILEENVKKIHELEVEINLKMESCKQDYYEDMKKEEQRLNNLEEACDAHEELLKNVVRKFQCDAIVQKFPSRMNEFKERLEDELNEMFMIFESSLEVRLKRRREIQEDIIPNALLEFRSSLQDVINGNPFISGQEYLLTFQQKSQPLLATVEAEISEVFTPNSKERIDVFKKFLDDINQAKEFVTNYSSIIKAETEVSIEKLITSTVSFVEEHPVFKSLVQDVSESLQEDLWAHTKSYFESQWAFPIDGEKKREAWSEVEKQVLNKVQTFLENMEKKREQDEKALQIISIAVLSNFCCNVEMVLSSGKFYFEEDLEPILTTGKMEAKAEFLKKLDDKDIPVVSKLEEMAIIIEDKIMQVREKNELSRKTAFTEALALCDEVFKNSMDSCRSEDELERVMEDAVTKSLEFLRSRYTNEAEEPREAIEGELKRYCEEAHKKILESFKPENEEVTNEVLGVAVRFYKDSMDKFLKGMPAINPKSLFEFHGFSLTSTLHKIRTTRKFVSKTLLISLHKRLNEAYTVYLDRNSLRNAQETNAAIGIDLGTTTSCVAIFKHGNATVIPDNSGKNLTPSWVYFDDDGSTMVGNEAKNQAHAFPEKTIFDSKRLIGRKFCDPTVQEDMKTWPFPITADRSGKPKISIGGKKYDPEHISALVLIHMKEIAEKYLSEPVTKAVITVPANFSDRQRDATKQAAEIAGLEVLQIINEPTAAAMAHALNWNEDAKTILVFDFGGGTFDVSILRTDFQPQISKSVTSPQDTTEVTKDAPTSSGARLKVLATKGHMHLGGEDFDSNLVNFCAKKFEEQHGSALLLETNGVSNVDKRVIYRRLYRIRNACEEAKINLTSNDSAPISLDSITNTQDLNVTVTRAEFEAMNESLFQEAIAIVEDAMDDAGIDKDEITDVIMVGGSSRIPRVKTLLQDFLGLPSLNINQKVDIQEAVALGAAVQACILNGGSSVCTLPEVKDIQPFSLGIEVRGGGMSVLIRRGTTIPKEATEMYYTVEDDQDTVRITIFAGEDLDLARNNITLGEFFLKGIPPGTAGAQQIAVHMRIDVNGILNVTATCTSTGGSHGLVIQDTRGRLTDDEILRMRAEMHRN